jgi:hypothetical protein
VALKKKRPILFRIFLKLPAKFPGERDVQTISSTAQGATITPLNKRWIDDLRKRAAVGREKGRDVATLPATDDVLRRFNRDTEWLATGILGALVSATLVLAALIQEGPPKSVDQAKEERQTGGNALVNANPSRSPKAVGEGSMREIRYGSPVAKIGRRDQQIRTTFR